MFSQKLIQQQCISITWIASTHGLGIRLSAGYQLLHFLESEAKGGLSTFVDGLAVVAA